MLPVVTHELPCDGGVWCPDGSLFVSQDLRVWDMRRSGSTPVRNLVTGADTVPAWSPDGCAVAFGRNDQVMVWELAAGVRALGFMPQPVEAVAWGRSGRVAASCGSDTRTTTGVWDNCHGMPRLREHSRPAQLWRPSTLEWDPEGRRLALGHGTDEFYAALVSDDRSDTLGTISGLGGCSTKMRWSPDGCSLALQHGYGTMVLRDGRAHVVSDEVRVGRHGIDWSSHGLAFTTCVWHQSQIGIRVVSYDLKTIASATLDNATNSVQWCGPELLLCSHMGQVSRIESKSDKNNRNGKLH